MQTDFLTANLEHHKEHQKLYRLLFLTEMNEKTVCGMALLVSLDEIVSSQQ